jgi:spore germination protein KB
VGTSVVFGFASQAKQDAWITVLLSLIFGSLLFWTYGKLFQSRPNTNWAGLLRLSFGKAGFLIGIVYVFVFIYAAARDLRDLGELTRTFLLPKTPIWVTLFLFQLLVAYICYIGLEGMARIAELNAPLVFFLFLIQIILLISSGPIRPELLTPVAENWKPILSSAFPGNFTVPYAETFAFAAFWSLTRSPGQYLKASLYSATTVSICFVILDILAVCTVGPELFSRSFFPLMTSYHLVNLGDFIKNIDPIIVTNYMIGVLIKVCVFTYAALAMISDLWSISGHKVAAVPVSLLILIFSLYMAENLSSHLFSGTYWVPWVIFLPFFVALPLVVLLMSNIRIKSERKE